MKPFSLILAVLMCAVVGAPQVAHPGVFKYSYNTAADFAVPTTALQIKDPSFPNALVFICYSEVRGTGQQITLQDGNGGSFLFPGGTGSVVGSSGTATTSVFVAPNDGLCRYMPNGIFITANTTGATATFIIKHN